MSKDNHRFPESFRNQVLETVVATGGINLTLVARLFNISPSTVTNWVKEEKIPVRSTRERIANGGRLGGISATDQLWPGVEERRALAKKLRSEGKSFVQIADACGYASQASVHYAIKQGA